MAKDIKEFMEDFNSSFSDLFTKYSASRGVSSLLTVSHLKDLGIDSFKDVQINDAHKMMILSAFRREGVKEGLLAIRDRNSNFRHSHAEATAEAFLEAGVDKTIFGERYYSLQTMQVGMKKFSKLIDNGKLTPEQFFKVVTSLAYVADTYDKSKVGIEYLSKFHEEAIPHFKGVVQLKKDGTAQFKGNYETAFSALGVNVEKLAELISGKGLPTDLTHENETVKSTNINLKNEPIQNLTTNGMKQASYAGKQAYSLIVSELLKAKLVDGVEPKDWFDRITQSQKEFIMPLLALNGEQSIEEVADSLFFKEALIDEAVYELTTNPKFDESLSNEFKQRPEFKKLEGEERRASIHKDLVGKILDASVTTGALAADNKTDFLYEISKACAKSPEIKSVFSGYEIIGIRESGQEVRKYDESYLYHDGIIYKYDNVDEEFISDEMFTTMKNHIRTNEESTKRGMAGNLVAGSAADLSEARVENFAPNSGNPLIKALNEKHTGEKIKEKIQEEQKVAVIQEEINTKQSKSGLYRSLPQYAEYMKMYQGYFSRYGIQIASASDTIKNYKERIEKQQNNVTTKTSIIAKNNDLDESTNDENIYNIDKEKDIHESTNEGSNDEEASADPSSSDTSGESTKVTKEILAELGRVSIEQDQPSGQ